MVVSVNKPTKLIDEIQLRNLQILSARLRSSLPDDASELNVNCVMEVTNQNATPVPSCSYCKSLNSDLPNRVVQLLNS